MLLKLGLYLPCLGRCGKKCGESLYLSGCKQSLKIAKGVEEGVEAAVGRSILLIDCARGDFWEECIGQSIIKVKNGFSVTKGYQEVLKNLQ